MKMQHKDKCGLPYAIILINHTQHVRNAFLFVWMPAVEALAAYDCLK
jgi:hypothetical protein